LPEHALVTILHFVLCYIAPEEFQQHWIEYSQDDAWYTDTSVKVLQKRLKKAVSQLNESNSSHGVKTLIEKIKKRLYTAQQLFFIEAIVSNSRCNSALLKFSLKEGLTHSDKGEIDLLIYALSQLLRKVGKSRKRLQRIEGKESISSSIAQWLSAVIDSNLSSLLSAKSNKQTSDCIELAKKEVSATIIQTNALLSLQDLMNHFDTVKNSNSSSKKVKEVTSTPPLYGIEMLVF
jgi:transcriptional regulator with XRE-family HTH domain